MNGTLLVNQEQNHNKFYLIVEERGEGINCRYGRIEQLRGGRFSNSKKYFGKSLYSQKNRKVRERGYTEVFFLEDTDEDIILQGAIDWARTGKIPSGEEVATEFLPWFNGGDEE